jgi:Type IV secretion-system coupling protein DNA-binding domain
MEHAHVIGTTGGGKTKFLEQCIHQDLIKGRGVCVIDPHGNHPDSLYRALLVWLDQNREKAWCINRTVHLIDPNTPTHVTGFDPLALPDDDYDPAVIADAAMDAIERVWGEEDLNTKPTLQRVLLATLTALCELDLTLAEATLLFDPSDRASIRAWAIKEITNDDTREELQWLHDIAGEPRGHQDFRAEVTGPRNRLAKLTRMDAIRAMVGQRGKRTIDFRAALDEGHIILANLSPGPRASDQACQLLGKLLTRFLFFHTQRRAHPERPFFFYLDECQLYLSGDVSRMLAEARKYGVGVTLAHQYLWQLQKAGEDILHAVRNTTNLKAVFRLKDTTDAEDLAQMVVPLDLEMPVQKLIKPTVVGHHIRRFESTSVSEQHSVTDTTTKTEAVSVSVTESSIESFAETFAEGESTASSDGTSVAAGRSQSSIAGTASGMSASQMMSPAEGWMETPVVLGLTEGTSSVIHSAQGSASSSMSARNTATATGKNSMHAVTVGSARGEAVSRGNSRGQSVGKGITTGTGITRGTTEGLEPIMADLPSAVHSLENMRYFAAQTLRNLTTGNAFVNFVDHGGMKSALLSVAPVSKITVSAAEFEALRARVLDASPSASRAEVAHQNVERRKKTLVELAECTLRPPEPSAPADFRVKKSRPAPEPPSPSGYRTKKEHPPKAEKDGKGKA